MGEIFTILTGSVLGAFLGYWTNHLYQIKSRPKIASYGFLWRPGVDSRYEFPFDDGDLLKFWFVLNGRSSPGASSIELVYKPSETDASPVSVFAKWDEAANPIAEERTEDGFTRSFFADRVPSTYFIPLRIGRLYTIPVIWGTPPVRKVMGPDMRMSDAVKQKEELMLFSGWWFDPQRPRPYFVPTVSRDGKIKIILNGEGLHWEDEFLIQDLVGGAALVERGESDTRQELLRHYLPENFQWKNKPTK